jgi:hypothetical protein
VSLLRRRGALRRRFPEVAVYGVAAAGLLGLLAVAGYAYRVSTGFQFEQGRYLLPLLALYAAALALAVLALPARWRAAGAGVLVVLALGHDLFAQLITLARYYG